jgi:DNA mismatch endonuclease (patch repair protein)
MDKLTRAERSRNMRAIRSVDTTPEVVVRRHVHRMGYRFRLHRRGLPGRPDLVFSSRRAVVFVHGCFWHQHSSRNCKIVRIPKSNLRYWRAKLARNVERDLLNRAALRSLGWRVLVIWECSIENERGWAKRLRNFLDQRQPFRSS